MKALHNYTEYLLQQLHDLQLCYEYAQSLVISKVTVLGVHSPCSLKVSAELSPRSTANATAAAATVTADPLPCYNVQPRRASSGNLNFCC
jgi:hypothetical protein